MGGVAAFNVVAKPIGAACNVHCAYCFYAEKARLFPAGENCKMPDEILELYIRRFITEQDAPEVDFVWQGGEPTLRGLDFFRRAVALQRRHAGGKVIRNALQTNGTLLDDAWGDFLAEHRFLVGVSIDGPEPLHDRHRQRRDGGGTWASALRGLRVLRRHGVEFNTLTVVHRDNARRPLEVYRFLRDLGSTFMQFLPLVERSPGAPSRSAGWRLAMPPADDAGGDVTEWSVAPADYGAFLCAIFDEWLRHDLGRVFVQIFESALANYLRLAPGLCVFAPTCGAALALEHNGDVYSCDHYVYPRYRLGNIRETALREMAGSHRQRQFGQAKAAELPAYCRRCDVAFLCHGECPKHRFRLTPDGEPGLNYLCPAYQTFFRHSLPVLRRMAEDWG
ncbi:MAG: anaerobic sulfatase maturase [Verrucomicrobiales bacterium]|jgi:uncharacterized protein|nr:anaerobic sulfatase maturase [Verrucomicrobiales bacterium]